MTLSVGRLRDEYEALRSQYVFASLDAVVTAAIGASWVSSGGSPSSGGGPRRYKRLQRGVNVVARLLPGGYEAMRNSLLKPSRVPLNGRQVTLIGFGSGVTVFLVTGPTDKGRDRALVLKLYRRTLGRRLEVLLEDARHRRATYQRVAGWYAGCSPLLPTHFTIAHGPLLSLPALACVQPYVAKPHRDVFSDFTERELVALVSSHQRLRSQFVSFSARTAHAVAQEGVCVDLIGRDNVVVVGSEDDMRLVLLEHGVHDLRKAGSSAVVEETRRRIAYLRRVADQVEQAVTSGEGGGGCQARQVTT